MTVKFDPETVGIDQRKARAVRRVRKHMARLAVVLFVAGLMLLFIGLGVAAMSIAGDSEEEILRRLAECRHYDDSPAATKAPTNGYNHKQQAESGKSG